jgi:hypothetical protein
LPKFGGWHLFAFLLTLFLGTFFRGAAETAGGRLRERMGDELRVDVHLAHVVDNHGHAPALTIGEHVVQERRLTLAEKPREHRHRQAGVGGSVGRTRGLGSWNGHAMILSRERHVGGVRSHVGVVSYMQLNCNNADPLLLLRGRDRPYDSADGGPGGGGWVS